MNAFLQSYLIAYLFWLEMTLGSIVLLWVHALTGGDWGKEIAPILKTAARLLPWMGLAFLPILFTLPHIYPWVDNVTSAKVLAKKDYLSTAAFSLRAIGIIGIWNALAYSYFRFERSSKKIAALGLVLYLFTATFAGIDWQMSLEPEWYSTIYGLVFGISIALGAYTFALFVKLTPTFWPGNGVNSWKRISPKIQRDLGNLLLTLVVLWTYLSFMQYLIIWLGNLPEEVVWVNHRMQGGWQSIACLLIILQFFAPFAALLFRSTKSSPKRMLGVVTVILFVRLLDRYWWIEPAYHPGKLFFEWRVPVTWLGFGAFWLSLFYWGFKKEQTHAASAG